MKIPHPPASKYVHTYSKQPQDLVVLTQNHMLCTLETQRFTLILSTSADAELWMKSMTNFTKGGLRQRSTKLTGDNLKHRELVLA